jgi:hypothetical protein
VRRSSSPAPSAAGIQFRLNKLTSPPSVLAPLRTNLNGHWRHSNAAAAYGKLQKFPLKNKKPMARRQR